MGSFGSFGLDAAQMWIGIRASEEETYAKQKQAQDNEKLAQRAAVDALQRGAVEAGQARMNTTRLIAEQNTAYANSGVDPTVGTAAQVQASTRATGEMDARTLENNATREAWGFRTYGDQYRQQAQLDVQRGNNHQAATLLGGTGRLVKDVGEYYGGGR